MAHEELAAVVDAGGLSAVLLELGDELARYSSKVRQGRAAGVAGLVAPLAAGQVGQPGPRGVTPATQPDGETPRRALGTMAP
ncbi:MAG: hypothetical protein M3N68_04800 [Actinomycetota bacterium]|nr:hypothetical protein [Actinomycetota bacterium]